MWIILICVRLILTCASPLKTASNSLKTIFEIIPAFKNFKTPSPTAIKRWVQKIGYYKLMLPKIVADDWMVIIDASIQMGDKKCLLVVGCHQADFPMNRALKLGDLEVLSLSVVSSLKADVITKVLNGVTQAVGKIVCICSDRGSEMLCGIRNFQKGSPGTRQTNDIAHRIANLLEATLEKSKIWKEFREKVTQSRRKMQNSLVPGFLPPSPRIKARYMNVDSLIIWAADMLLLLDNPYSLPESEIKELKKYIEWLLLYREVIGYWNRIVLISVVARNLVRKESIHMNVADSFQELLSTLKMGPRELKFADVLVMFLLEQSRGMKPGERLIGSSEVLESLFGKMKYMEHEQTAFGFTSLILAAMGHVGSLDEELIKQAITTVKLSDIDEWSLRAIGKSIQSQRRQVKKSVVDLKKKLEQEVTGFLEEKVMGF